MVRNNIFKDFPMPAHFLSLTVSHQMAESIVNGAWTCIAYGGQFNDKIRL